MALVAYSDNSDVGTDSEDGEENLNYKNQKVDEWKGSQDPSKGVDSVKLCVVNTTEHKEDFAMDKVTSTGLFSSVPAAVPVRSLFATGEETDDEVMDVPTVETWKVTQELKKQNSEMVASGFETQHTQPHKKDKKRVKIFIPSLSEFADDEDEEEEVKEPPKKKLNPSRSGTGLFSVLPEPKHTSAKEVRRPLVPHVLTKKPSQTQKIMKKVTERSSTAIGAADKVSDDEDEVSTEASDFFSLSEVSHTEHARAAPEFASSCVPAAVEPCLEPIREESRVHCSQSKDLSLSLEHHHQNFVEVGPYIKEQESSQPATATTASIDEATMLRLAGKRGRTDPINFIDVNADDALLTRQEWMTKALSEEKPQHGFSRKREGLPTQKQKQKHQITYLAHQAKERELDLKNTWAQNRMTKMQSQAKYGF